MSEVSEKNDLLEKLRAPFGDSDIGKLPKPTKAQTEAVKKDFTQGIRCNICGGWHHKNVVHLDYVGHAAITKRLLDVDSGWYWEPMGTSDGIPVIDQNGGLWIKLHVAGMSRIGYGHADKKQGGDAIKEAIGDAIRNAGMRFGMALELWHKGEFDKSVAAAEADSELEKQKESDRKKDAYAEIDSWIKKCLDAADVKTPNKEAKAKYLAAVIPQLQQKCAEKIVSAESRVKRLEEIIKTTQES